MITISATSESVIAFDLIPSASSQFRLKAAGGRMKGSKWEFPPLVSSIKMIQRRFPDAVLQPAAASIIDHRPSDQRYYHRSWETLYEYQKESVRQLIESPLRGALLGLSPGLGKTAVSIVAAEILQSKSILVVAPLSLLRNWQREIERWGTGKSWIVRSPVDSFTFEIGEWVITNYDYLVRHESQFARNWDLVIFDESILIKTRSARRSLSAQHISKDARRVWGLSGSPISKSPDDLFNQFKTFLPSFFRSYWRFAEEYCIIERTPWGTNVLGGKPGIDLRAEFADFTAFRNQSEVLDLPPEHHVLIELQLLPDQQRVHEKLLRDFILELSTEDVPVQTVMTQILKMLQVTSNLANLQPEKDASIKSNTVVEMIETESLPLPTIIWTHWRSTAESLVKRLRLNALLKIGYLSSDLSVDERDQLVTEFQSGQIHVLVVSLGVGKFGLTLTEAQSMVYYDRSFDADALVQSSFRVHRIGLDHPVTVFTLKCLDSADEIVDMNLHGKLGDISSLTKAQLQELMMNLQTRRC